MGPLTACIILPLFHNADSRGRRKPVPQKDFEKTGVELADLFGGCSSAPGSAFTGYWKSETGKPMQDENTYLEVMELGPWDLKSVHDYCRDTLLDRFKQEAIMVKFMAPGTFGGLVTKVEV